MFLQAKKEDNFFKHSSFPDEMEMDGWILMFVVKIISC